MRSGQRIGESRLHDPLRARAVGAVPARAGCGCAARGCARTACKGNGVRAGVCAHCVQAGSVCTQCARQAGVSAHGVQAGSVCTLCSRQAGLCASCVKAGSVCTLCGRQTEVRARCVIVSVCTLCTRLLDARFHFGAQAAVIWDTPCLSLPSSGTAGRRPPQLLYFLSEFKPKVSSTCHPEAHGMEDGRSPRPLLTQFH